MARTLQLSLPQPRTWGSRRAGAGRKLTPGRRRLAPPRSRPHRRAAATSRPDETVAPRRFLSPAETCLGSDSPCRKPTGVGVGRRPGYADPRHVDGRREHALPTDPGTRLPDPSAEPGAALLAPAARPTRLDLAEGAPRRRGRLRRAPVRPHPRRAAPPRRGRRRRDLRRRRPLVHSV